ncbi:hypothetical protein AMR72_16625 [Flavobacterium psychrophilum]|nr:hypothetical protein AMR72_16625 [Flavobacterium psychrophilum]AOE53982.1 hypothetical protein ALW18_16615 [Flavobacterium psychrophilum]
MKKFRKMIIIIAILIGFPVLVIVVNKLSSIYYDKEYTDADKGASSKNYTITKLDIPGRISFHFSTQRTMLPGEEDITSHVFYDKAQNKTMVVATQYIANDSGFNDEVEFYYAIDNQGNISKLDSIPETARLVKNQLVPFQRWHDKSQVIYMRHFAKQDFDPPSLNPLRGMGNPTGGSPGYYWNGPGYYDLKFKNDVLKLKFPCKSRAFLFSNDYDYETGLNYYLLPNQDIAFIIDYKNREPTSIYMIKHK